MSCGELLNVESVDEPGLMRLYREATHHGNLLGIEAVPNGTNDLRIDETPGKLQSDNDGKNYSIYFVEELNRNDLIMAIGHELGHLLLIGKYGLIPPELRFLLDNDAQETIQTIQNVTHHLILLNLLWKEYGIRSDLHLDLIRGNLGEYSSNRELLQEVKALRVFEYEKLVGNVEDVVSVGIEGELFHKAYQSAGTHFGKYGFEHIPSPPDYKEDIISFLKDIGQIGKGCKSQ